MNYPFGQQGHQQFPGTYHHQPNTFQNQPSIYQQQQPTTYPPPLYRFFTHQQQATYPPTPKQFFPQQYYHQMASYSPEFSTEQALWLKIMGKPASAMTDDEFLHEFAKLNATLDDLDKRYPEYAGGAGFRAAFVHIYGQGVRVPPSEPRMRKINDSAWEVHMPDGMVVYRYAPKLRADAPEFVPKAQEIQDKKGDEGEFTDSAAKEAQDKKDKANEDEEDEEPAEEGAILTVLLNVIIEAANIGRATVESENFNDADPAGDGDNPDDRAGFVVKKVSRRGSSGLFFKLNTGEPEDGL
jgi:hypothetical protein